MEEVTCMRDTNRTCAVVSALVRHIVTAWRTSFAQNVAMKFNCFFLLPFLDEFPFILRTELDSLYDGDMSHLFDMREARAELERRVRDLELECKSNTKLQSKFEWLNAQLTNAKSWDSTEDLYASAGEEMVVKEEDERKDEPPPPPPADDNDEPPADGGFPADDDVELTDEWGDDDLEDLDVDLDNIDEEEEISVNHVMDLGDDLDLAAGEVGDAEADVADFQSADFVLDLDELGTDWEEEDDVDEPTGFLPRRVDEKPVSEGPASWQQGRISRTEGLRRGEEPSRTD
jgi:hypothetical protein